ncbi:MAG: AraC family transcriptional regulator [Brumimicrobium sp.]
MIVKEKLNNLNMPFISIDLGKIELEDKISNDQLEQLKSTLLESGLEVMSDKRSVLIEKIKNTIIEMIHHDDELPKIKFSEHLSEKLQYDYTYLANLFSKTEGITIAQFILLHKIERIKEFIIYDELTLTEISYKMNYSSVAALSNQFKKITGLTPSFFKSLKHARREVIENL